MNDMQQNIGKTMARLNCILSFVQAAASKGELFYQSTIINLLKPQRQAASKLNNSLVSKLSSKKSLAIRRMLITIFSFGPKKKKKDHTKTQKSR